MGTKSKRQHYVPQFYLREFARERKGKPQVFCFDKKKAVSFLTAVDNVAAESYFYDIGEEQGAEKVFSELEGRMSKSYKFLLESSDVGDLPANVKVAISVMIATQHLRTKDFREVIKESSEYVLRLAKQKGVSKDDSTLRIIAGLAQEEIAKRYQFTLMEKSITEFALSLIQMKWVLFVNNTDIPFWCSDNPFTYSNTLAYDRYDGLGFERLGSQTHFPLSPKPSLEIVDPIMYAFYPSKIYIDNKENIIFNNHLQVKNSKRYIFSSANDFSLADQMLAKNPRLMETDRNRFETQDFHTIVPPKALLPRR